MSKAKKCATKGCKNKAVGHIYLEFSYDPTEGCGSSDMSDELCACCLAAFLQNRVYELKKVEVQKD